MHRYWMGLRRGRWSVLLIALFVIGSHNVQAQVAPAAGSKVRSLVLGNWGMTAWADGALHGFTYAPATGQFLALIDRSADPAASQAEIVAFTPYEEILYTVDLSATPGYASSMAFDNAQARLLLIDNALTHIAQMPVDEAGRLAPAVEPLLDVAAWGLGSVTGMAVAQDGTTVFVLDGANAQLVSASLDPANAAAAQKLDLSHLGAGDLSGLALHPVTGHLVVVSAGSQAIYELTPAGELFARYDAAALSLADPRAMTFAPTADLTDAPDRVRLFVANSTGRDPAGGRAWLNVVTEVSLEPRVGAAATMAATPLPLLQTIDTSAWDAPSPDPSGAAYLPEGTLLVVDGEVDEIDHIFEHTGANMFGITLDGTLEYTGTTKSFSHEPTDAAYNPANGHIFISDDNNWGTAQNQERRLFEVNLGPDGELNTDDDVVTYFKPSEFDSLDPEGLTYDPTSGVLYIADGLNAEVYRVDPGPNGKFDGIAAEGGDDVVTHFDVEVLGIFDPEGIDYDPISGNLLMTGNDPALLYELTTDGDLVRTYDISEASIIKPAGVVMAPGSANPRKASYYIMDRGIDNNSDPMQNDGKIFEFGTNITLPEPEPTPTPTPRPTPTPKPDAIFADGFESGNLSAWSEARSNAGSLSATKAAAIAGEYGLAVKIANNISTYVIDDSPVNDARYRARFYFDPNSIQMAENDLHYIFHAYSGDEEVVRLMFRISQGAYQVRPGLFNNGRTWIPANWITLSDGPHLLELDWKASSAPGANDGYLNFWLDGVQRANVSGVNNDTHRIERIRLGAASGIDDGTRGTYYFDAFESRRESYIGPASDGPPPPDMRLMLPFISTD